MAFGSTGAEPDSCTATSGGADGSTGADDTTGAMGGPPFGDIEALVSCEPQTECQIDQQLLTNVSAHFDVFAAEEVTLAIIDGQTPCGPGAKIEGLDPGEEAKALAAAFDLRNGDVIGEVGVVTIDGIEDAMEAVSDLLEIPSTLLVVRRPTGAGCESLAYQLDVL